MFIADYSMIKEQSSMAQSTRVKVGDQVCITLSVRELKDAQRNFGGYHDEMESVRILIFQEKHPLLCGEIISMFINFV